MEVTLKNTDEQERLKALATGVNREFKHDKLKDITATSEVFVLAPCPRERHLLDLFRDIFTRIDQSSLLPIRQLEGLARLIQDAKSGCLEADDLVKTLELLSTRLMSIYSQSPLVRYIVQLGKALESLDLNTLMSIETPTSDDVCDLVETTFRSHTGRHGQPFPAKKSDEHILAFQWRRWVLLQAWPCIPHRQRRIQHMQTRLRE
ncbi:MAG: hypothetical protein J3Q66DRAFT_375816 [Benniella sp.]|nr:MAG: hypothetical protein J3Q66DRAFT_375816 [Benniella sp.]